MWKEVKCRNSGDRWLYRRDDSTGDPEREAVGGLTLKKQSRWRDRKSTSLRRRSWGARTGTAQTWVRRLRLMETEKFSLRMWMWCRGQEWDFISALLSLSGNKYTSIIFILKVPTGAFPPLPPRSSSYNQCVCTIQIKNNKGALGDRDQESSN